MLKIRERVAARVILVHSACVHPDTYWTRFGDACCTECHVIVERGVCTPNAGCE